MYKVIIKTKEGNKEYVVENLKELKEEFEKPNDGVYIDTIQHYKQKLIEERDELLSHVVGMSYRTEKAKELTKQIMAFEKNTKI